MQLTSLIAAGAAALAMAVAPAADTSIQPGDEPGAGGVGRLVDGNTAFALDLYAALRAEEGNLFVSPHSISAALAMVSAGARAETAAQMSATLHFDPVGEALHPAFAKLDGALRTAGEDGPDAIEVAIANRLWGRPGATFREAFLDVMRAHYGAGLQTVDFGGDLEGARRTINGWVEERTRSRIRELLRPSDLSPSTELVLTNAIYFKGAWAVRFDEQDTRDAPFFTGPDRSISVPMMSLTTDVPYLESDVLKAVELPYEGDRLSMVVLLPRRRDGLRDLEETLTADHLRRWLDDLQPQQVHVRLPRFRLEDRHALERTLPAMGMPLAFAPGRADFSGICGAPGAIWIDAVIHQALVEVNEQGTVAAGATAVVLKRGGRPPIFEADHPFVFLVRDRHTGAILFIGRCVDPG
jgi:serpin B